MHRAISRLPKSVLSIQSHVVYGHAGNSAAVFPMRRLGVDVWPLNTVQFSNHTQYGKWEGMVIPGEQVTELVDGLSAIQVLPRCDAVLSGYLGSPEQGNLIVEAVRRIKQANPSAIYCCDPVMGDPEKGCIVPKGVQDFHRNQAANVADIMCPNILELGVLTGLNPSSAEEVVIAARALMKKGPRMVFVKNTGKACAIEPDTFEMMLVTAEGAWRIATPLVAMQRQPVGTGDLTSGLFVAKLLLGATPVEALEHATAAYYDVMTVTAALGQYELQLVASQDMIASPTSAFKAVPV